MKKIQEVAGRSAKHEAAGFFRRLWAKLSQLFEPEEVEVTFEQVGNEVRYTYTKVPHRQVA